MNVSYNDQIGLIYMVAMCVTVPPLYYYRVRYIGLRQLHIGLQLTHVYEQQCSDG